MIPFKINWGGDWEAKPEPKKRNRYVVRPASFHQWAVCDQPADRPVTRCITRAMARRIARLLNEDERQEGGE